MCFCLIHIAHFSSYTDNFSILPDLSTIYTQQLFLILYTQQLFLILYKSYILYSSSFPRIENKFGDSINLGGDVFPIYTLEI